MSNCACCIVANCADLVVLQSAQFGINGARSCTILSWWHLMVYRYWEMGTICGHQSNTLKCIHSREPSLELHKDCALDYRYIHLWNWTRQLWARAILYNLWWMRLYISTNYGAHDRMPRCVAHYTNCNNNIVLIVTNTTVNL